MMRIAPLLMMVSALAFATSKQNSQVDVVYGQDDRVDVAKLKSEFYSKRAAATAANVYMGNFQKNEQDQFSIPNFLTLSSPEGSNVCSDERFADQPTISGCTGFLIKDDILVTAGHCVTKMGTTVKDNKTEECAQNLWMFDYKTDENGSISFENMNTNNLYLCEKVLFAKYEGMIEVNGKRVSGDDFAIVKLSRKVTGREPLEIRTEGKIQLNDDIFVIGTPTGLPLKVSGNAIVSTNHFSRHFSTNLDTFGGNSGSPVFNAVTGVVEGILVRGKTDYIMEEKGDGTSCKRSNICDSDGKNCLDDKDSDRNIRLFSKPSEDVTRITQILEHL